MRIRLNHLLNVLDLAILADVESPTARTLLFFVHDAEGFCYLPIWIAENGVVKIETLRESSVGINVVAARCEVGYIELANLVAARTERLAFFRSPAGERLREPGNDDGSLALQVRRLVGLSVAALEFKIRGRIARI